MLGLSLYPHHLKDNTNCTVESFCEMVAKTAEIMELKHIGIGSDLCLDQPDTVVEWMRNGTWSKSKNYGEGSKNKPGFPKQPEWFEDARGFKNIETYLFKTVFYVFKSSCILKPLWLFWKPWFIFRSFSIIFTFRPSAISHPFNNSIWLIQTKI